MKTVVHESLLGGRLVLAKQANGACVFLNDHGRCCIHEQHGAEAKPAICRMFPLQLVPLERFIFLTSRRSCPSAAADHGRSLDEHLAPLKKSELIRPLVTSPASPPAVVRGARRSWREFLAAAEVLTQLTIDDRLPLVRRLVHGLRFCALLEECKIAHVKEQSWDELMRCLAELAVENAGKYFRDRQPPSRGTGMVVRQIAAHYIQSHPGFTTTGCWRERWRTLFMSARFARGKGAVPPFHPKFPPATFDGLERPLGRLADEVTYPLNRFFETQAMSKYYAIVGHKRSLVESFRALALLYPMALWLLRLTIGKREPMPSDAVDIVVALERGQGLTGVYRGATAMANTQQLECVLAWYAR